MLNQAQDVISGQGWESVAVGSVRGRSHENSGVSGVHNVFISVIILIIILRLRYRLAPATTYTPPPVRLPMMPPGYTHTHNSGFVPPSLTCFEHKMFSNVL